MYWFTGDWHLGHSNVIKYCGRPFKDINEMNHILIDNFNNIVDVGDITIHAGDFSFLDLKNTEKIIKTLNGNHIFLQGCHDKWAKSKKLGQIWRKVIGGIPIVVCHYCLRVWWKSHYNSFMFYSHSHGCLNPIGKSWDIGVDNNDFKPVSFDELIKIMKNRPDNPNIVSNKHF